jgi:hypothetical protein
MSHHYTISGSISYAEYIIDIYHSSDGDTVDISLVETALDELPQDLNPRTLTESLVSSFQDILKIDIKDLENNIVLTTEVNPHID